MNASVEKLRAAARGIKVGDRVRSYDLPGERTDCYVEGDVEGYKWMEGCNRYVIRVHRTIWEGMVEPNGPPVIFPPVNGTRSWLGGETDGVVLDEEVS